MKSNNRAIIMHPMAAILGICLDVLHYVLLTTYVSRKIILLMRWIYGTCGIKMLIISVFRT